MSTALAEANKRFDEAIFEVLNPDVRTPRKVWAELRAAQAKESDPRADSWVTALTCMGLVRELVRMGEIDNPFSDAE